MEILSIEKACIKNRNQVLFENLSLTIREGQHWALVGPGGSGKTALLKTIAGDYFVAAGSITHHYYQDYRASHNIFDSLFSHRHLISYVDVKHDFTNLSHTRDFFYQQRFNASYADETQTVEEYLDEIADKAVVQGPWNRDRVLEDFNLASLRRKHLIKLSNGENKRLRIAAALLKNPVVLLLDNPLTGLDVGSRKYFETLFLEISRNGTTMIMATSPHHIPDVITHVLAIDARRHIQIFTRPEFNPDEVDLSSRSRPLPSPEELSGLLDGRNSKSCELLVGMKNVHVSYGDVNVLKNVNWKVKPGEHWALSGPNGSGKSTLLSLIYGDHPQAYANDIVLFDRRRGSGESIWDIKKNIGFMSPELFQYFPGNYTCRQVVESGFYDTMGLYRSVPEAEKQLAQKWVEVMGLTKYQDLLFSDISSTIQRLCLLTRALVKKPDLLILDEPCQGFDAIQQQDFRKLIDTIAGLSNLAIIYVTHYHEELPECIDQELILRG